MYVVNCESIRKKNKLNILLKYFRINYLSHVFDIKTSVPAWMLLIKLHPSYHISNNKYIRSY